MLIQADDYKYQIATIEDKTGAEHKFIVNANGSIQHSKNTQYKEDGDTLITTKTSTTFATDGQFKYEITSNDTTYDENSDLTGIDIDEFVVISK